MAATMSRAKRDNVPGQVVNRQIINQKARWSWFFGYLPPILIMSGAIGLTTWLAPYAYAKYQYMQAKPILQSLLTNDLGLADEFLTAETPTKSLVGSSPSPRSTTPLLSIAAINIAAPIVADVDVNRQYNYNMALKNGLAHMKGTAALTATSGNSFIFGHSSRFTSSGSAYDNIFANLDRLKENDIIELSSGDSLQQYKVNRSQAVEANDTSVLHQGKERIITLMTCWPLGTTAKRWIVQAQLLLPSH